MKDERYIALKAITKTAKKRFSLTKYNSFNVATKAEYYVAPEDLPTLIEVITFARAESIPYHVLGGGTNVLFNDGIVPGITIHLCNFNAIGLFGKSVVAQTGVQINDLTSFALEKELAGLEFAHGLPGTVGGATYMNARCYGSEFSEVISFVRFLDKDLVFRELASDEIAFEYKKTPFQTSESIIIEVVFSLHHGRKLDINTRMLDNYADRKNRKQYLFPSAGCAFVNDRRFGMPSGKIIDMLGLKGMMVGGARVARFHGNFIINYKNATARDIYLLIKKVQIAVKEKKGIMLVPEVRLLGKW